MAFRVWDLLALVLRVSGLGFRVLGLGSCRASVDQRLVRGVVGGMRGCARFVLEGLRVVFHGAAGITYVGMARLE